MLAYAVMGWLAWRALRLYLSGNGLLLAALIFSSAYGASDEWHQSFVPGRLADAADWLADTLGAMLALLLIRRFRVKRKKEAA